MVSGGVAGKGEEFSGVQMDVAEQMTHKNVSKQRDFLNLAHVEAKLYSLGLQDKKSKFRMSIDNS